MCIELVGQHWLVSDGSNKQFLERGRAQRMVVMVLVLARMVIGSVLFIGEGRLGWTEIRECGRYVLGVCMGGVCIMHVIGVDR